MHGCISEKVSYCSVRSHNQVVKKMFDACQEVGLIDDVRRWSDISCRAGRGLGLKDINDTFEALERRVESFKALKQEWCMSVQ